MSTKEATATKSTIKPDVLALSKKIEESLKLDPKTGVCMEAEGSNVYDNNLPEGITPATVEALDQYDARFIAATGHAFGNLSMEAMTGNKKLEKTETQVRMGSSSNIAMSVDRVRQYPNPQGKDGEKIVKYGVLTAVYQNTAGDKRGQLKVVREDLMAAAMDRFSK